MNNRLSYCGLVDPRISASDKDLPVPKENSKIDKNVEKKCPHCEEKIPKDHSNEDIKKCKQALKYIHDLLCLQCNIIFMCKFEIFRHVVLHHLDDDDVEMNEIQGQSRQTGFFF